MAWSQRPSTVVHNRKTSVDRPALAYKCTNMMGSGTRRQHNHRRCRNQTPVASRSLAVIAAAVLRLESMAAPCDFEKLPWNETWAFLQCDAPIASVRCHEL